MEVYHEEVYNESTGIQRGKVDDLQHCSIPNDLYHRNIPGNLPDERPEGVGGKGEEQQQSEGDKRFYQRHGKPC